MSPVEEIQTLCQAFLTLFAEADKEIEISANKKILASKVLGIMQKYTLMPGKMIQNCRNIIDFIHQKKVSTNSAKQSQELISKLSQIKILEADRTGAFLIFYDYLQASLDYFWVYNRNRGSTRNLSSTPSKKEKSDKTPKNLAELDEALEISREILKQSINSMSSTFNLSLNEEIGMIKDHPKSDVFNHDFYLNNFTEISAKQIKNDQAADASCLKCSLF